MHRLTVNTRQKGRRPTDSYCHKQRPCTWPALQAVAVCGPQMALAVALQVLRFGQQVGARAAASGVIRLAVASIACRRPKRFRTVSVAPTARGERPKGGSERREVTPDRPLPPGGGSAEWKGQGQLRGFAANMVKRIGINGDDRLKSNSISGFDASLIRTWTLDAPSSSDHCRPANRSVFY